MSGKIRQALRDLGIYRGRVRVKNTGGRDWVWLDGAFFGIFDELRGTFVD